MGRSWEDRYNSFRTAAAFHAIRLYPATSSNPQRVDEWTFFGRTGQGVTVLVDTGSGSQLEPLQPPLDYAEVRLYDAEDNLVASGSNSVAGEVASLLGVQLSTDGTYRVEVSAPTAQPGSTGNYLLSVWDATVDVAPTSFGEQYFGQIETACSVDRWTFSAQENQQIQLDLANASNPDIRFKLSGPEGWAGFDGLAEDSPLITLPYSGSYVLEAYSIGSLGGSYAFSLNETSLTELTLGLDARGNIRRERSGAVIPCDGARARQFDRISG